MERIAAEIEQVNRNFYAKVVLTTLVYVTIYGLMWFYFSAYLSCVLALVSWWIMTPLVLYLDRKGYGSTSRLLFIMACAFYILTAKVGISDHIDIIVYYLAAALLPALLFDPGKKREILAGMVICLCGWIYVRYGTMPEIPTSWRPTSLPVQELRDLNFFGSFIIIFILIKFFVERFYLSTEELNKFFDVVLDILCIARPEGCFKKINPAFRLLLGYTETDLKTKPFIEFVHPEDVERTLAIFERIKQGEKTVRFENRYRCKNGQYVVLSWSAVGDPLTKNVYAAARDITSVMQKEMELKQVFDAIDRSGLVAMTNIDGRITSVNENFCIRSGYSREELLGQDHKLIKSGVHSKDFIRNLWETILAGKVWSGEIQNKTKEGKAFFVQTVIAPMTDIFGKTQKFLSIQFDVTQQKESERMLEEAQEVARIGSWSYDAH